MASLMVAADCAIVVAVLVASCVHSIRKLMRMGEGESEHDFRFGDELGFDRVLSDMIVVVANENFVASEVAAVDQLAAGTNQTGLTNTSGYRPCQEIYSRT